MPELSTPFLLMAEYGAADVPLEAVADKYLQLSRRQAYAQARRQALPFPVYRAGSNKSPWMVRITDLATYLDTQRAAARAEWEAINGRAAQHA